MNQTDDDKDFEMLSLGAVTRNVVAFLQMPSARQRAEPLRTKPAGNDADFRTPCSSVPKLEQGVAALQLPGELLSMG